jgi:hypothetical protein
MAPGETAGGSSTMVEHTPKHPKVEAWNTTGGSITVLLTCLTGLD